MASTLRFFFKFSLFHNYNMFGSCIIHILYTSTLKLKNNFGAKSLNDISLVHRTVNFIRIVYKLVLIASKI